MKARELEKVSLSDIENLRTVSKTLTVGHKYFFVNRDKLTQPIQIQLSQKQKRFSEFFNALSKSMLNFEHFLKKMTLIAVVFPKLQTPKNVVR